MDERETKAALEYVEQQAPISEVAAFYRDSIKRDSEINPEIADLSYGVRTSKDAVLARMLPDDVEQLRDINRSGLFILDLMFRPGPKSLHKGKPEEGKKGKFTIDEYLKYEHELALYYLRLTRATVTELSKENERDIIAKQVFEHRTISNVPSRRLTFFGRRRGGEG